MTAEDDTKEDPGSDEKPPKLSSLSTRGLFASLRERGDDSVSTPDSGTARSRGFFSSPKSPIVAMSPNLMNINPLKSNMSKFLTPSRTFSRLRDEREELSRLTPSTPPHDLHDGFTLPLVGEIKPAFLYKLAKDWLRNPKNIALLVWGLAVGVSGAILFMVMVGMLDAVLPNRNARNTWFEVSNQIINALFTLMCVYLHPQRCLHLYMLWRWKASDIVKLRNIYCKNGTRKPHEWGHMLVVVMLLQLNCFAQYALCGLNWGYRRAQRPPIGVAVCLCLSLGGASGAGIYNIVSPLGKDFDLEAEDIQEDQEKGTHDTHLGEITPRTKIYRMLERRRSFACREQGSLVESPEWRGGLFDITNEPPISILSVFCCVCVFGWNMDRLGFGNRFVHIVTFILICTAPFWIFDLAALNIENREVRNAIGGSGIVLCAFGLLYGGYWRIRMRERYNLPGNKFCCGKPSVTDCFQWFYCPLCSLCQEVRTAEFYDVKDDKFYTRGNNQASPPSASPPPGFPSPRTPGPTLSAVQEMPDPLRHMNSSDVELFAHDSLSRESSQPASKGVLVPPAPVTASRNPFLSPLSDGNALGTDSSPSHVSPAATKNPFLPASANSLPFSNNPFLKPEQFSRDSTPVRSPTHLGASNNPFHPPDMSSVADDSPLRGASSPRNLFSPPEMSSADDSPHLRSPLRRPSSPRNPFSPPEMLSGAEGNVPHSLRISVPSNPFLQPEVAASELKN